MISSKPVFGPILVATPSLELVYLIEMKRTSVNYSYAEFIEMK